MMEVYGVMCPFCGTMIFKETAEAAAGLVQCELCKRIFQPQETIRGITADQVTGPCDAA